MSNILNMADILADVMSSATETELVETKIGDAVDRTFASRNVIYKLGAKDKEPNGSVFAQFMTLSLPFKLSGEKVAKDYTTLTKSRRVKYSGSVEEVIANYIIKSKSNPELLALASKPIKEMGLNVDLSQYDLTNMDSMKSLYSRLAKVEPLVGRDGEIVKGGKDKKDIVYAWNNNAYNPLRFERPVIQFNFTDIKEPYIKPEDPKAQYWDSVFLEKSLGELDLIEDESERIKQTPFILSLYLFQQKLFRNEHKALMDADKTIISGSKTEDELNKKIYSKAILRKPSSKEYCLGYKFPIDDNNKIEGLEELAELTPEELLEQIKVGPFGTLEKKLNNELTDPDEYKNAIVGSVLIGKVAPSQTASGGQAILDAKAKLKPSINDMVDNNFAPEVLSNFQAKLYYAYKLLMTKTPEEFKEFVLDRIDDYDLTRADQKGVIDGVVRKFRDNFPVDYLIQYLDAEGYALGMVVFDKIYTPEERERLANFAKLKEENKDSNSMLTDGMASVPQLSDAEAMELKARELQRLQAEAEANSNKDSNFDQDANDKQVSEDDAEDFLSGLNSSEVLTIDDEDMEAPAPINTDLY